MKDTMEALRKRTRDKVQKLKKQLDGLDAMALSGYDQEELGRVKKRVDDTDRALGEGDVDEARGMARQAHEGLRQLAMDLHDEEMRGWTRTPPKLRKSREQVSQDRGSLAREIAEELDKAMPKPSQLMSSEDAKRMSELAKRQEALRKRAQEMAKDLGKPRLGPDGKPLPVPVPRELAPGLREAGQHMERAEGELRGQAPREAVGEEGQALEKLNQMKEQMQRERRRGSTGGRAHGQGAGAHPRRRRVPRAQGVPPGPARRDEARRAGRVQGAAQALLRGPGEMRSRRLPASARRRLGLCVLAIAVPLRAAAATPEHTYGLVEEQRLEEAVRELEPMLRARPHDPEVAFVDGDLALHRGDYGRAAERFGEAAKLRGRVGEEAKQLRDLARSTEETTKGFVALRGQHFVVWHQPGKDNLLAPYALVALEKAMAALGDDLGWRPSEPVRVEIYPEVADLARVSTLTQKEIETSGTIALCKYNRLMIVSPRALAPPRRCERRLGRADNARARRGGRATTRGRPDGG